MFLWIIKESCLNSWTFGLNVVPLQAEKNITFQTERTDTMKKLLLMIVVVMMTTVVVKGQESLAGRVYHCGNLMKKELGDLKKDAKQLEKEAESEKEKEEVKGLTAITDAIVSKMTIKFINDKTAEMSMEAKFDEQKAKEGGASWLLRKMVKLKIGKGMNEKGQITYTVNGRNVTIIGLNKKNKMNFVLSEDGKKLTRTDKEKTFVLDCIK